MLSHRFAAEILREYDIRGLVGDNLTETDAHALGKAFATYLSEEIPDRKQHVVCVGYDGRLSSPALEQALNEGLVSSGIRVIRIGLGPSPMLYFAVRHLKADAGIMVTGSHNPASHNGFKMTTDSHPVFGAEIQKIGDKAAAGAFIQARGSIKQTNVKDDYIVRLLQDLTLTRPLKVAWDCGNGATGDILKRMIAKMPGTHILLYEEIDGRFPNHHPDPTVDENLRDLQKCVLKNGCDLGIAFDGDGDRIGVVDQSGAIIRCDTLLMIYARDVLARHKGATIIGDVKCSAVLFEEIRRLGGVPVMWKTGHSVIKDKMRDMQAPLAGELSGHIFFADGYYGYDDALYCAIRLLNALEKHTLAELTAHLPQQFNTPEIRITVKEEEKFFLIDALHANLKQADYDIITIDGLRVNTPEGWFLIRASNTQNCLTVRVEAKSEKCLRALIKLVDEEIKKFGYSLFL